MSRVYLLAADKELPPCDFQEPCTSCSGGYTVTLLQGFKVEELSYYCQGVEELGYPMKPFRYELSMQNEEEDLKNLRAYLEENFSRGEVVELWSVWVGDVNKKCPPRFQGRLEELDLEALEQFLSAEEICFRVRR